MRSTSEILSDVKDNVDVSKEELRMALLVLDSVNFFNHKRLKLLISGEVGAELTKRDFPGACAELGISDLELQAMKMDPIKYLGESHIPGTEAWKDFHRLGEKVLQKVMNLQKES